MQDEKKTEQQTASSTAAIALNLVGEQLFRLADLGERQLAARLDGNVKMTNLTATLQEGYVKLADGLSVLNIKLSELADGLRSRVEPVAGVTPKLALAAPGLQENISASSRSPLEPHQKSLEVIRKAAQENSGPRLSATVRSVLRKQLYINNCAKNNIEWWKRRGWGPRPKNHEIKAANDVYRPFVDKALIWVGNFYTPELRRFAVPVPDTVLAILYMVADEGDNPQPDITEFLTDVVSGVSFLDKPYRAWCHRILSGVAARASAHARMCTTDSSEMAAAIYAAWRAECNKTPVRELVWNLPEIPTRVVNAQKRRVRRQDRKKQLRLGI